MGDIKRNEELKERTARAIKELGVSAKKMAGGLENFNKAFNQFYESIKNSEVPTEMREKLDKKKSEIVDYIEPLGISEAEIGQYLSDEILAQAVCYDLCPETVCECLISETAFKELYVTAVKQHLAENLKNSGLI